ncbi:hypothetical protein C0581_01500 [Candidatus Parcubacteria bacterium]|nr:MAG: hypothetical protein C0581_01500 [Candidatus Parcubacteria bacterium]
MTSESQRGLEANAAMRASSEPTSSQDSGILERRNGLPVISRDNFSSLASLDDGKTRSFVGYFVYESGESDPVFQDVIMTGGLRKKDLQGHESIRLKVMGTASSGMEREPKDVDEYKMLVDIPDSVQDQLGIRMLITNDIIPVAEFEEKKGDPEDPDLIAGSTISYEMPDSRQFVDGKLEKDPIAREKAAIINQMVVDFIERGGDLTKLRSFIELLEKKMEEMDNILDSSVSR